MKIYLGQQAVRNLEHPPSTKSQRKNTRESQDPDQNLQVEVIGQGQLHALEGQGQEVKIDTVQEGAPGQTAGTEGEGLAATTGDQGQGREADIQGQGPEAMISLTGGQEGNNGKCLLIRYCVTYCLISCSPFNICLVERVFILPA